MLRHFSLDFSSIPMIKYWLCCYTSGAFSFCMHLAWLSGKLWSTWMTVWFVCAFRVCFVFPRGLLKITIPLTDLCFGRMLGWAMQTLWKQGGCRNNSFKFQKAPFHCVTYSSLQWTQSIWFILKLLRGCMFNLWRVDPFYQTACRERKLPLYTASLNYESRGINYSCHVTVIKTFHINVTHGSFVFLLVLKDTFLRHIGVSDNMFKLHSQQTLSF